MAPPSKSASSRLQRPLLTATALGLALGCHSQAIANPFGTAPVSDETLGDMRGGFDLPNGMKLSVGVQIDTFVDRTLALRTVLNVTDAAKSVLQVTVPALTKTDVPASIPTAGQALPQAAPVTETLTAVTVTPMVSILPAGSAVPSDGGASVVAADVEIPSDLGLVTIKQTDSGSSIILNGPNLEIQHITGNNTGVLIANTLDNRSIDTVATVNISLSDSAVPVGNIMLRMESIMLDAVGRDLY